MALDLDALWIQFEILWPASVAGILVIATHVPFGREVLHRGIIFLDLAIAQIAGLGLIAVNTFGVDDYGPFVRQLIAVLTATVASLLLYRLRTLDSKVQEALIGIAFILAATGSVLLLSSDPHGGERLKDLLVGQILWVTTAQLFWVALIYSIVLFVWFRFRDQQGGWMFYPLFALSITVSTQLVGVYLVFASLIIPALSVRCMREGRALTWGYGMGICAYFLGLLVSAWKDWPSGATIAWCLALVGFVCFYVSPLLSAAYSKDRVVE